jgi:hypothetical protein
MPPGKLGQAIAAAVILVGGLAVGNDAPPRATKDLLEEIPRAITKEPNYGSPPRYALLVFGHQAKARVWIVEDGKTLYVDKNGNGDLTDDGPPIKPSNVHELGKTPTGGASWDFDYLLPEIRAADGSRHTAFDLRRWNYGRNEDGYGLSVKLNGRTEMYAGWFGFWGNSPASAPVIHFGGPLQPCLLRLDEFVIDGLSRDLSIAFINPGCGPAGTSRLSTDALSKAVVPEVVIDWPVAKGAPSLHSSHLLFQRCCYWHFYNGKFKIPSGVVQGTAIVKVFVPGGALPLPLSTNEIKVPVRTRNAAKGGK